MQSEISGLFQNSQKESSEKLLLALSITQISKDDYADFHDFSMCLVSV